MKGWFGLLASFFPNEPVDFGELFVVHPIFMVFDQSVEK